jgi:cAMP-specific phosphodiesterase 4
VRFVLDVSRKSAYLAKANVMMASSTIVALLVVTAALLFVTHASVVAPLERIFGVIQSSAAAALGALRMDGAGGAGLGGGDDEGGPAMSAVEAAVAKLSRLVTHMSGGGGGPRASGGALAEYLDDANVDAHTRAWLASQLGHSDADAAASASAAHAAAAAAAAAASRRASSSPMPPGYAHSFASVGGAGGGTPSFASAAGTNGATGSSFAIGYALPSGEPEVPLELLDSWEFDALELSTGQLLASVVKMFDAVGAFSARLVTPQRLWAFAGALAAGYRTDNPYHNFAHAVDVAHGVFRFLRLTERRLRLPTADKFALLVAALSHDVEHPGVNNAFLVQRRDALALRYNDASVLENAHVAALYGLCASSPEADVFAGLVDDATWRAARKLVVSAVLATDMAHHFKLVAQAELYLELHGDAPRCGADGAPLDGGCDALSGNATGNSIVSAAGSAAGGGGLSPSIAASTTGGASAAAAPAAPPFSTPEERVLLYSLFLHAADVGNPARPRHVASKWADRVLEEFFAQGDAERAAGLPVSAMCDRGATSRAASQINFIEFVVAPLYGVLARALPELTPCLRTLAANRRAFADEYEAEAADAAARGAKAPADAADDAAKMRNRYRSFAAKYEPLAGPLEPLGDVAASPGHGAAAGGVLHKQGSSCRDSGGAVDISGRASSTAAAAPAASAAAARGGAGGGSNASGGSGGGGLSPVRRRGVLGGGGGGGGGSLSSGWLHYGSAVRSLFGDGGSNASRAGGAANAPASRSARRSNSFVAVDEGNGGAGGADPEAGLQRSSTTGGGAAGRRGSGAFAAPRRPSRP